MQFKILLHCSQMEGIKTVCYSLFCVCLKWNERWIWSSYGRKLFGVNFLEIMQNFAILKGTKLFLKKIEQFCGKNSLKQYKVSSRLKSGFRSASCQRLASFTPNTRLRSVWGRILFTFAFLVWNFDRIWAKIAEKAEQI